MQKAQQEIEMKILDLLCKEEVMWKQRSRICWLNEGDKNTSFFHRTATGRQKRNSIKSLSREDGVMVQTEAEIEVEFRRYFQQLFTSQENIDMSEALEAVEPVVTSEMNSALRKPYTKEEIAAALSQMHPLKAPGPDAVIAYNPSFTWRNIMAGRDIIQKGIMWRVGDGLSIRVWKDQWIPNLPQFSMAVERDEETAGLLVADLFNDGGDAWNIQKIQSLFPVEVVKEILSIPLPTHRRADKLIWKHCRNGIYTVRSGYQVACQIRDFQKEVTESSVSEKPIWKWLNQLHALPKVRHFMWRAAKGILPVASELKKRKVKCDDICMRCGQAMETIEHCLRTCPWWFESIAMTDEPRYHSLFAMLIYIIWKKRNLLVFQKEIISQKACIDIATKLFNEFQDLLDKPPQLRIVIEKEKWLPPPEDVWKVNVDASFKENGDYGIGVVIRNSRSRVIVSRCKGGKNVMSAEAAEALACQEVYQALTADKDDWSYCGEVVSSVRHAATHFEKVVFSWARRKANSMAHSVGQTSY
ncbi:hypothetical protein C2S52_015834 [Perilla frutescens var. hirtella]|nr:hypothetical protein C2S52_015834 [Perilla frutescens var. hirtella]